MSGLTPSDDPRRDAEGPTEGPADDEVRVFEAWDPDNPERAKSPRRGMCAAVLFLEAITLGLTTPVLVQLADLSITAALWIGLGLAGACLLLSGMLRREWAYQAGWVLQIGAIAIGFQIPSMFFIGGIFALLWASADLLGRRIERDRAEAWAAYDAERGAQRDD